MIASMGCSTEGAEAGAGAGTADAGVEAAVAAGGTETASGTGAGTERMRHTQAPPRIATAASAATTGLVSNRDIG
jgi:hypothetical protein